jgi:hypothetical protein
MVDTCCVPRFTFRGHRAESGSPLEPDELRSEIQNDLRPPPGAYALRAAIGNTVRVGGHDYQTYVNGTIHGRRMVLRFYDDHEGRWDEWLRPKLAGNIEPDGRGSIVQYRLKLRPFWIPPVVFIGVGIATLAAGLYSLGRSHADGSAYAVITGLVLVVLGPIFLLSLAAGATKSSAQLETWLAERCSRQAVTSPLISSQAAWYPDPHNGGWRWWTGYAWAAHANTPIPPIAPEP